MAAASRPPVPARAMTALEVVHGSVFPSQQCHVRRTKDHAELSHCSLVSLSSNMTQSYCLRRIVGQLPKLCCSYVPFRQLNATMPFQKTIDGLLNEQPTPSNTCYLCSQEMIPFDPLDQNEDGKESHNDASITAYLPCCLKRCHEFCLGKALRAQCAKQHPEETQRTSNEPICRGCADIVECPGCDAQISDIDHVWNADAAASNSTWDKLSDTDKRKQERQQYERRIRARETMRLTKSKARVNMRIAKNQTRRHVSAREHDNNARLLVGQITKAIARAHGENGGGQAGDDIQIITDAPRIPASSVNPPRQVTVEDEYDEMMDAGGLF